MLLNLPGRVGNVTLARTNALHPLFEALVNAIQSIQSSRRKTSGSIEVQVLRDERAGSLDLPDVSDEESITAFIVTDNGTGFDAANYESFNTSDTRRKVALGGKGVGRLLWLKAFDKVGVDSVFADGNGMFRRRFEFQLSPQGIENLTVEQVPEGTAILTRVALSGMKHEYQQTCPKRLQTIAERIVEHCLAYFMLPNCPRISVRDRTSVLDLQDVWAEMFQETIEGAVEVQGQTFRVVQLRLYGSGYNHALHFCANDREVQALKIAKLLPGLPGRLYDSNRKPFVWAAYVFGDYLDTHVHPERGSFTIPVDDTNDDLLPNEPSLAAITKGLLPLLEKGLKPFLEPLEHEKAVRYKAFVEEQAPEYRPVLKYTNVVRELPPYLTDDQLEAELHRRKRDLELQVRKEAGELARDDKAAMPDEFIQRLIDVNQANLTKYVLSRREVLQVLSRSLGLRPDGKYYLEDAIHRVVFPMRSTSDEVLSHNLWVIDERLSYHAYLASDLPLKDQDQLENDSPQRPDIVVYNSGIFDAPAAFSESGVPFSSVVVIEFKRPLRDDYRDDKNPITQVYEYVEKIRDGRAKDSNGRLIPLTKDVPFYCYVVCDLTPKLKRMAGYANLRPTPDSLGFFGFNDELRAYIEVIGYDKMISDAKKRNRAFFDKLGLPPL